MNGPLNYWREAVLDAEGDTVELPTVLARYLFAALDKAEAHALETARVRTLDEARADRPRYNNRQGW